MATNFDWYNDCSYNFKHYNYDQFPSLVHPFYSMLADCNHRLNPLSPYLVIIITIQVVGICNRPFFFLYQKPVYASFYFGWLEVKNWVVSFIFEILLFKM
jgi:hypothetical protein